MVHTVLPPVKAKTDSSVSSSCHGQNLTSYSVDSKILSMHSQRQHSSIFESYEKLLAETVRDVRVERQDVILPFTYTESGTPLERRKDIGRTRHG